MRINFTRLLVLSLLISSVAERAAAAPAKHTFAIGEDDFLLDGQRFQIRCGEVHAPRVPREYWRHRLQMAKAMGLNTVCAYLFWNMHEPRPGEFNWTGQADAAEFCRIAQQEGLWVILRPGPYACAEWEMGGFPWWLLKEEGIQLRTRDPRYIRAATHYLREVGRELGSLQITKGGPILMVQVENEYGFFGKDAEYMGELRQALIDAGFDVPLFACNPRDHLKDGYRADLFPVVNFGSDPAAAFKSLREILPKGPLMCGEFYPGWFDTWGQPHHTGKMEPYLRDLEYMLKNGASFSIYMAHGGTTFGLWSGADRPFKPDTSSYDYDAPISEAGWVTEKFLKTRELMSKYLLPGEKLPDVPPQNRMLGNIAPIQFTEAAPLFSNLPSAIPDERPKTMEQYDQGYGSIVYRTRLAAGPPATLEARAAHDTALVFVDGNRVGVMDRRSRNFRVRLPERSQEVRLDILVEPMGRVNFGAEVHDRKGLHGPVKLVEGDGSNRELTGWEVFCLPMNDAMPGKLKYGSAGNISGPAFWRARMDLKGTGDTFLDLRSWSKGVVWVNGHCLGRFWNIGPSQTAYLPAPWLKEQNEIVILDLFGPEKPIVNALDKPVLNELRPELDFARVRRPSVQLGLDGVEPAKEGEFAAGSGTQEIRFAPVKGRFFCLESVNAFDGKAFAAVAELDLMGEDGKVLSHEGWTVAYVDSEERSAEDGTAENAIDGQTVNFWHTDWSGTKPGHPHRLVLDLGRSQILSGFRYVPRQGDGSVGGRIKGYRVFVGDSLVRK